MRHARFLASISASALVATALVATTFAPTAAFADSPSPRAQAATTVHARGDVVATRPVVSTISPQYGAFGGGTRVVVKGKRLAGATSVKFGSTPAKSFRVVSAKKIVAKAPAGSGRAPVRVTTGHGKSKKRAAAVFKYSAFVTSVSPSSFPADGGALVTVKGSGFSGPGKKSRSLRAGTVSAVLFGSTPATQLTVVNSSTVTAISPPLPPGGGAVRVVIDGVASPAGPGSSFVAVPTPVVVAPAVTGLSPTSGPAAGGTSVTIAGTGFTGATAVKFGTTAASFTVDSDTQLTATTPAGIAGAVNVSVETPSGTSTPTGASTFAYLAQPQVTGLAPTSGTISGGTSVTVTGTGFTDATAVEFGDLPAASFTVDSDTQITAISPASGSGVVDVTVTTAGGTSAQTAAGEFTYVAVTPTLTGLTPNQGVWSGGTSVIISGTGFSGALTVKFGGTSATFTVDSDTQITAISPRVCPTTVNVTVTNEAGTSATSVSSQFTYVEGISGLGAGGPILPMC